MSPRPVVVTALQGAGWHPAAWRVAGPAARRLSSLRHWREVVVEQDRLGVDAVTIEDSFTAGPATAGPATAGPATAGPATAGPANDGPATAGPAIADGDLDTDTVVGQLDALLVANAVAPATRAIGLVPTVSVTHTEPFHVATGLQTLDHVSLGRAGWRVQVSPTTREAALFGRRPGGDDVTTLFAEAREVVEVAHRLWDSWDDDAIIRDVVTGRFIDRDRIHGAAFTGEYVSVHGASIVPRSPQGRPPVFALAHDAVAARFAVDTADVVLVTPGASGASGASGLEARGALALVRDAEQAAGSSVRRPVLADLAVLIGSSPAAASDALAELDAAARTPYGDVSDAAVLATTVPELVERIAELGDLGYAGIRLRPLRIPVDATAIARQLVPALVTAGLRADVASRPAADLRTRLGLVPATSRYAEARREAARPAEARHATARSESLV